MRPLMATQLEPAAEAGLSTLVYDATRQVSLLASGEPAAHATSLETLTRVSLEDPDEEPVGYDTGTKVANESPDEPPRWSVEPGGLDAGAMF